MSERSGGGVPRFLIAAFLADCSTYLLFTAVPLKVIALGGSALVLGLLPAATAGVYVLAALAFGRLADRWSRTRMVRSGAAIMAASALATAFVEAIPGFFPVLALGALGRALFWPALQAELGSRGSARLLGRRMGCFNVSWSGGKMLGFFVAGHLTEAFSTTAPLALAFLLGLGIVALAPTPAREIATGEAAAADRPAPSPPVRRRYRLSAWAANLVGYGVAATLNYQFPKRLLALGFREGDVGNFLGLIGLTQTLAFAFLGWRHGWEYRRSWILGSLAWGMISTAALALFTNRIGILACAPGVGLALGVAYSASLYHSLHQEPVPGRNAGIHEALLGSGVLVVPLIAGAAGDAFGHHAPTLVGGLAFAGALAFAAWMLARLPAASRRSPTQASQLVR